MIFDDEMQTTTMMIYGYKYECFIQSEFLAGRYAMRMFLLSDSHS